MEREAGTRRFLICCDSVRSSPTLQLRLAWLVFQLGNLLLSSTFEASIFELRTHLWHVWNSFLKAKICFFRADSVMSVRTLTSFGSELWIIDNRNMAGYLSNRRGEEGKLSIRYRISENSTIINRGFFWSQSIMTNKAFFLMQFHHDLLARPLSVVLSRISNRTNLILDGRRSRQRIIASFCKLH